MELMEITRNHVDWPNFANLLEEFIAVREKFLRFSLSSILCFQNSKANCLVRSSRLCLSIFNFVNVFPLRWVTTNERVF